MTYITIVGLRYYFGNEVFRVGQRLLIEKDIDNEEDDEAIRVISDAGVTFGHVANSVRTVARGCKSAGRIYDWFEKQTEIRIMFILSDVVIASVELPAVMSIMNKDTEDLSF